MNNWFPIVINVQGASEKDCKKGKQFAGCSQDSPWVTACIHGAVRPYPTITVSLAIREQEFRIVGAVSCHLIH